MEEYVDADRLLLKGHPEYNEKWVQARIAANPKILGLGDLVLLQQERRQPSGGRLDLLCQDRETKRRYEVEIQLGSTDEAHIIRAIEYWDIERKRYPQYDHCAVLIAEDVTSRFQNVISLFNGAVPLIAIQMQACKIKNSLTLIFTTVMDEFTRGVVDEDEEAQAAPTDRADWERRVSPNTVAMADDLLEIVREFDPELRLKYNKFYIGLAKGDRPNNFVTFVPMKRAFRVEPRLPLADETVDKIEREGFEANYDKLWRRYRIDLNKDDVKKHRAFLRDIMKLAFDARE